MLKFDNGQAFFLCCMDHRLMTVGTNKVNHITFMEIKTGKNTLNDNQKMIRKAVNEYRVKAEEIK